MNSDRRRPAWVLLWIVLLMGGAVLAGARPVFWESAETIEADTEAPILPPSLGASSPSSQWAVDAERLDRLLLSRSVLVVDMDTETTLYARNETVPVYPASLTKLMTQLVAVERLDRLDRIVRIPPQVLEELVQEESSLAGFAPNEPVTVRDLLHANIVRSAGEAAETLALEVAGSRAAFVQMMNDRAHELNMTTAHFENPTGLHAPTQRMSAVDVYKLLRVALRNPLFADTFGGESFRTTPTAVHPEGLWVPSVFAMRLSDQEIQNESYAFLGAKTGFTEEAGVCLATLAEKDGSALLIITMGAPYENDRAQSIREHNWILQLLQSRSLEESRQ